MQATHEYHKLLEEILDNGKKKHDRTSTGTLSIPSYQIRFDMKHGFPLITTKKLHWKSIAHELLWFLSGSTNIKYLNENGVTIWDEWADENGDLGPVYGKQWVDWAKYNKEGITQHPKQFITMTNSINQIQNALDKLRNNPTDRGNIVSAWNVGELDQMALRPCHWAFQLITEELTYDEKVAEARNRFGFDHSTEGWRTFDINSKESIEFLTSKQYRLHLKWHQRSVDTFLGLPFNIASYALLLHMFAQQANMVPGTLIGDLSEVHIYDNHIDYVKEQLERDKFKYATPTLKLNKAEDIFSYKYEDFTIQNYQAYPNWRNVPIAV